MMQQLSDDKTSESRLINCCKRVRGM